MDILNKNIPVAIYWKIAPGIVLVSRYRTPEEPHQGGQDVDDGVTLHSQKREKKVFTLEHTRERYSIVGTYILPQTHRLTALTRGADRQSACCSCSCTYT